MSFIFKIYFLLNIFIDTIYCEYFCNKYSYFSPETEYHCSGLKINPNKGDECCCLWKFFDLGENKTITRCSSISRDQYNNLDGYIQRKSSNYSNLEIRCTDDQILYCSNIVLDEEDFKDCSKLGIPFKDDKFCCKWHYKDSTNNYKVNDYCASINEYEYLTIEYYIRYKNDAPDQRYDDLTIDCLGTFIKIYEFFFLLLLFII